MMQETIHMESTPMVFIPLLGILLFFLFLVVIVVIIIVKILIHNQKLGEWATYPNRDLLPENHHTPYMGFPAHATARAAVSKFCPNCGKIVIR